MAVLPAQSLLFDTGATEGDRMAENGSVSPILIETIILVSYGRQSTWLNPDVAD